MERFEGILKFIIIHSPKLFWFWIIYERIWISRLQIFKIKIIMKLFILFFFFFCQKEILFNTKERAGLIKTTVLAEQGKRAHVIIFWTKIKKTYYIYQHKSIFEYNTVQEAPPAHGFRSSRPHYTSTQFHLQSQLEIDCELHKALESYAGAWECKSCWALEGYE